MQSLDDRDMVTVDVIVIVETKVVRIVNRRDIGYGTGHDYTAGEAIF